MDISSTTTGSSRETQKLARTISKNLKPKDVIALVGDLGAGKTTFVQGLLSEFGISGGESPTFVLIKPYPLKKPIRRIREIVHIDAFRTTSLSDALSSGISDVLSSPGSVAVVEWADRIKNLIPQNSLWITFEHRSGNTREIKWQKK